jgi:hypothetical protein
MERRMFLRLALGGLAAAATSSLATTGEAASRAAKIHAVERTAIGTTLTLALEHAPFPCPGAPWTDPTVIAFVPHHYRAPKGDGVDVLVHFHGHNTTAAEAVVAHALREQVTDSKQNLVLLVPQGPVHAADGSPGKLDHPRGLRRLLAEAIGVLATHHAARELGDAALPSRPELGMVALSAHSGGYRPAAACLDHGGVDVREVYLFDALYGELATYRDWVVARKDAHGRARHKLVSHFVSQEVRRNNRALEAMLEAAGVRCTRDVLGPRGGAISRAELTHARAVFVDGNASHTDVTHASNQLRDCLFASCFRRVLPSDWFEEKDGPRPVDPRS